MVDLDLPTDRGAATVAEAAFRARVRGLGGRVHWRSRLLPGRFNVRDLPPAAIPALARAPGVVRLRPDHQARALLAESVPLIGALYGDPDLWNAYGGLGVPVCLLDSGLYRFHTMFDDDNDVETATGRIVAWRDFIFDETVAYDDDGHGSHMGGVIWGRLGLTVDDEPFQGVAPKARMLAGKVLNSQGIGLFSDVQAGLEWCAGLEPDSPFPPAKVINLSLGGGLYSGVCDGADPTGTAEVVNAVAGMGILVVAAAGNESTENAVATPACASGALSVGAVYDADEGGVSLGACSDPASGPDQPTCFTNGWDHLDVVAPGCVTYSAGLFTPSLLVAGCGTSQAAAHVSGLAALIFAANPGITAAQVRARLVDTARDLGPPGHDRISGHGRVQAGPAVQGCFFPGGVEVTCGDGQDNDCDGRIDCDDPDCCGGEACAAGDTDGDGFGACDCDDAAPLAWSLPGPAGGLTVTVEAGGAGLWWQAPADAGGLDLAHDLLRSTAAADFEAAAVCLETADAADTAAFDGDMPAAGTAFFYLPRPRNGCGPVAPVGYASSGRPRRARSCP
jgi:hypothetical protein